MERQADAERYQGCKEMFRTLLATKNEPIMNQYRITYTHDDMPSDYRGNTIKWAHTEKEAINLILRKNPEKDGTCVFKRGGSGKILTVKEVYQTQE